MFNDIPGKFHKNIRKVAYFLIGLLVVLCLYVSYIQVVESHTLANHPLNRRNVEAAHKIEQGQILDRRGEKIAYSIPDGNGGYKRTYPLGAVTAHISGYNSIQFGKAGIESSFGNYLSGTSNPERSLGPITHLFETKKGNNVTLTIDSHLQTIAYKALGNSRGAIVAISPRTGEILAMVSKPSFDPNRIDQQWQSVSQSSESPLLNRALQGLYPPGSTIKVMVAEAALAEKIASPQRIFDCSGILKIGPDYTLQEDNQVAHGKINLEEALAVSCNITFGTLSLELGPDKMSKTFSRFGFDKSTGDELQEFSSRLPNFSKLGKGDLAQTGIGQGSLLVTPLRMAMLASSFANNGAMMKPFLVKEVSAPDGTVLHQFTPEIWLTPTSSQLADQVRQMMVKVVEEGTGTGAQIPGIVVAGKTGTAENPHGAPHAWFIGFAPADNPQIAIAVIVENGGSGGRVAAPIAREIFREALL